jgi:outer membrane protein assembly factor BamB
MPSTANPHLRTRAMAHVVAVVLLLGASVFALTARSPSARAQEAAPVTASADESVAFQMTAAHGGSLSGGPEKPPLVKKWVRDLGGPVSYPVITNGRVFLTTSGGAGNALHALDANTGQDVWGPLDLAGAYGFTAVTAGDGRVYALNHDGILRAFDQVTGIQDWIVDLPGQYSFSAPPTFFGGHVYVSGAGIGGTVYSVDAATGEVQWTANVSGGDNSSPAVSSTGVYVAYGCDNVYDLDPTTGATIWHYFPGGCFGGAGITPVLAGGQLWVRASAGSSPKVLDAATGQLKNSFSARTAPALDGNRAFFLNGSVLQARDATTLAPTWSFTGDGNLSAGPIVVNGFVYVASTSGSVWALDELTGAIAWTDNIGIIVASPDEGNAVVRSGLAAGQGIVAVPASNTLVAYAPVVSRFVPTTPTRLLDTRVGGPQTGYSGARPTADQTVDLQVTSRGGIPAVGVTAVALNVTATEASAPGFVTAWPSGSARPSVSTLNVAQAGQTISAPVIVPVGPDGKVSLYTLGGAHLVADVSGYFSPSLSSTDGRLVSVAPSRLLDTRLVPGSRPSNNGTVAIPVAGQGGVPATGASAVVLNVTATNASAPGFVTAWPSGTPRPLASTVNITRKGQTIADTVIVPIGADGNVNLFVNSSTDLVVDVSGYFTDGSAAASDSGLYVPMTPTRVADTRPGTRLNYVGTKPLPGSTTTFSLDALGTPDGPGRAAVVATLTGVQATKPGHLTIWSGNEARPNTSILNLEDASQTIANLPIVGVGGDNTVSVYTYGGAHFVLDLEGYFQQ